MGGLALSAGPSREGKITRDAAKGAELQLRLEVGDGLIAMNATPPVHVDPKTGLIGKIELGLSVPRIRIDGARDQYRRPSVFPATRSSRLALAFATSPVFGMSVSPVRRGTLAENRFWRVSAIFFAWSKPWFANHRQLVVIDGNTPRF